MTATKEGSNYLYRCLAVSMFSVACGGHHSPGRAEASAPSGPTPPAACIAPPLSVPDNAACGCDRDCQSETCMTESETGSPGGYCLRLCERSGPSACAPGDRCIYFADLGYGLCVDACTTTADCQPGNYCDTLDGICNPICAADGDCRSGHCDTYLGACTDGTPPKGRGVDEACVRNSDCKSQFCNSYTQRCSTSCVPSRAACPEGAVCIPKQDGNDWGVCHRSCTAGTGCADPAVPCVQIPGTSRSACVPPEPACSGRAAADTNAQNCNCGYDCKVGTDCLREENSGDPRGFCRAFCTPNGAECGPGQVCFVSTGESKGLCRIACHKETDCPVGDICSGNSGACFSLCQADSDCLGGYCNRYTGYCEPTPSIGALTGGACNGSGDCRSGICLAHGFCTSLCSVVRNGCPDGALCIGFDESDSQGWCALPCQGNQECPAALSCTVGEAGSPSYCAR